MIELSTRRRIRITQTLTDLVLQRTSNIRHHRPWFESDELNATYQSLIESIRELVSTPNSTASARRLLQITEFINTSAEQGKFLSPNSERASITFSQDLQSLIENRTQSIDSSRVDGLTEQLKLRQQELNREVKDTIRTIDEKGQTLTASLERQGKVERSKFTSSADEKIAELSQQLQTQVTVSLLEMQTEASKKESEVITSAVSKASTAIDTHREQALKAINTSQETAESEVKGIVSSLTSQVDEHAIAFEDLHIKLRKTLQHVSNDVLADASFKQADKEETTADKLRIVGVVWLFCAIVYFLKGFEFADLIADDGTPQYALIMLRAFVIIFCSAPGFYILRESARHRTDERRYRQKGIQLATIDGYFAELEKADKNKVKQELSKHYFNGDDHFVDTSSVDKVQSGYDKVFDTVLKNASAKRNTTQSK